ncbi:hypothetical protein ACT691_03570 [Vibrio metschnikovii]
MYEQVGLGNLVCSEITVHDIESWNQENYDIQHKEVLKQNITIGLRIE